MAHVFLVVSSHERWRAYNKVYNVVAVCATRESAIREANNFITNNRHIAMTLDGNECGFEYLGEELEESDLFSCPAHIGYTTYYDEFPYHKIMFEDGHRKGVWAVHIEEWDCLE